MTMMEDFNQWNPPVVQAQPMQQPIAYPMAQPNSFAPTGGMLGEMVDERMQWQSPARNQILQDFNLDPATTGAGFQMQGTNTPTAVTDYMSGNWPVGGSAGQLTYAPNLIPSYTSFRNPNQNAFDMGNIGGGTISSLPPLGRGTDVDSYGLRINTGHPGANPFSMGLSNTFDPALAAQNPNFPMGGRYNYWTGSDPTEKIWNYDPYNALQLDAYGNPLSRMMDPFQSYR